MSKEILAIDIGTRKVMAIIASAQGPDLRVCDAETMEHTSRPMFDGQVHSIDEVARNVSRIKEILEKRSGRTLDRAGVAVAGRNLLTRKITAHLENDSVEEITLDMVRSVELEAISRMISESKEELSRYYCVGYSAVYYELDGERLQDLAGHRGQKVNAHVIATFLPKVVLDSIFAVLKKSGLEAGNITLEPIAAINAIVPLQMRRLNIVLVDIGAGTSDLAISRDGVVFAYGMVPEAGDEITECICSQLLVDFEVGEHIKRAAGSSEDITYKDIWDRDHTIKSAKVLELIRPAVRKLASSIAVAALELNGSSPQAVIAVGGGSLTPGLLKELAACLALPVEKVGIRLPGAIKGLVDATGKLTGPEAVTPVGIAWMTAAEQGLKFIDITVNAKKVKMLDMLQRKDILGALSASGIIFDKKLYPKMGLALSFEVDGSFRTVKGTVGRAAEITVNGKKAESLRDQVSGGDVIEFIEAQDGADAQAVVSDVVDLHPVRCMFNDSQISVIPAVTINGEYASLETPVTDRARINVEPVNVRQVLAKQNIQTDSLTEREILVNIDRTPRVLLQRNYTLKVNGKAAGLDARVCFGDMIEFSREQPTSYRIRDVIDIPEAADAIKINVNGQDIEVYISACQVFMNGSQVRPDEFLIDGADISVYYSKRREAMLSDIFKYINVDTAGVLGKRMSFFVDDAPAGFTTNVCDGARVRILFEERN